MRCTSRHLRLFRCIVASAMGMSRPKPGMRCSAIIRIAGFSSHKVCGVSLPNFRSRFGRLASFELYPVLAVRCKLIRKKKKKSLSHYCKTGLSGVVMSASAWVVLRQPGDKRNLASAWGYEILSVSLGMIVSFFWRQLGDKGVSLGIKASARG